ncbi:MAG: HAD family hydrolase [Pseudoramibacter sp.]|jgi:Cof subfamily protein (haloacid dehalogenase superfamily)
MIKLIATDADGTLFPDCGQDLSAAYFETVQALMDRGVIFGVCSGRPASNLKRVFAPIQDQIFYITQNGAMASYQDKIVYREAIPMADTRAIVRDIRALDGCMTLYDTGEVCYFEKRDKEAYEFTRDVYHFDCELVDDLLELDTPCIKFSVYRADHVEEVTEKTFAPKWRKKMNVACAGERVVDMVPKAASKGASLAKMQALFGVSMDETLAFGDNSNDISMLNQAKYSVAVDNARQAVKDVCRYVTDRNTDDGELKVLDALLKDFDHPEAALRPFEK